MTNDKTRRCGRDLVRILAVCREQGRVAVVDGDSVAVLLRRRRPLPDGAREVHYEVRRIRTVTEACLSGF